jgi:type I restriction enzyme S subunit
MSEWKTYKLGELATIKGGKRLPKGVLLQSTPNSHPYIRIRDLGKTRILELDSTYEYVDDLTQKCIARYIVEKGDILLSIVGTIGLVGIVGESLHLANQTENCVKLINLNKVDRLYLYYYLSSKIGQIEIHKGIVGAVQAKLPIKNIENIEISLPPLAEQKRIADILSAIDDKIELNRRINANLEQQAQALYKEWFVAVEKDNWEEKRLGDIIELYDSQRRPLSGQQRANMDKIYPYYGAASLMDYVDNYLFDGIYLLLGEDGTVSDSEGFPMLQYVWGKFWVNNHAHILQGKNGYTTESLYILLKQTNVSSIITGAVQPKISQANLKSIPIKLPPIELLSNYNKIIKPLFEEIRNNSTQINQLSTLRDTLLPKLMSGEIDV